jgi:hypothetical protein
LAETLVKSVPATATGLVLRPGPVLRGGVWVCGTVWWCGWWRCSGILLGPEGTSPGGVCLLGPVWVWSSNCCPGGWCVVAVGLGLVVV